MSLKSEDYMKCRNAIIVISAMSNVFPPTKSLATGSYRQANQNLGPALADAVEWAESKGFDDLKLLATTCHGFLRNKTSFLATESEFFKATGKAGGATANAPIAKTTTPTSTAGAQPPQAPPPALIPQPKPADLVPATSVRPAQIAEPTPT